MPSNPGTTRLHLNVRDAKLSELTTRLFFIGLTIVWVVLTVWLDLWTESSGLSKVFLILPIVIGVTNATISFDSSDIVLDPGTTASQVTSYVLISSSILAPWLSTIVDRRKSGVIRVIKAFVLMLLLLIVGQFDILALRRNKAAEVYWETGLLTCAIGLLGYSVSQYLFMSYTPLPTWSGGFDKESAVAASRSALTVAAQMSTLPTIERSVTP